MTRIAGLTGAGVDDGRYSAVAFARNGDHGAHGRLDDRAGRESCGIIADRHRTASFAVGVATLAFAAHRVAERLG